MIGAKVREANWRVREEDEVLKVPPGKFLIFTISTLSKAIILAHYFCHRSILDEDLRMRTNA